VGKLKETNMSKYQAGKQAWVQYANDKYGGYKTVGLAVLVRKAIEENGQWVCKYVDSETVENKKRGEFVEHERNLNLRCIKRINDQGGYHTHQCSREIWKDGFCKLHHPDTVRQRTDETEARWKAKMADTPMAKAGKRIQELEARVKELEGIIEQLFNRRSEIK